jgi:hypothetical protein
MNNECRVLWKTTFGSMATFGEGNALTIVQANR